MIHEPTNAEGPIPTVGQFAERRCLMRLQQLLPKCVAFVVLVALAGCATPRNPASHDQIVAFARDGQVKMFYDMRMHPSAVQHGNMIYIAWRGTAGLPQAISYDLASRRFSSQVSIFEGLEYDTASRVYAADQHTTPVIWRDADGHLEILAGCYGLKSFEVTACDRARTMEAGDIDSGWERIAAPIAPSINYAKVMEVAGGGTAIFYRNGGHLGSWTYRVSPDGYSGWEAPEREVIDMNFGAHPDQSCLDFYAGSYSNARMSPDGLTMHIAFVWQQEFGSLDVWPPELADNDCRVPPSVLYSGANVPQGRTRYNLYYLGVDLASGIASNVRGEQLTMPVTRSIADREAQILDTGGRLFTVPPTIHFDADGTPRFFGVISGESPNSGWFTQVRFVDGDWRETRIVHTSNVWNASLVDWDAEGNLRALVIVGDGEEEAAPAGPTDLNGFGWGERIEEWVSADDGTNWSRRRVIVPQPGMRFQNLRAVSTGMGSYSNEVFLFYGWNADASPGEGVAFLWDDRR